MNEFDEIHDALKKEATKWAYEIGTAINADTNNAETINALKYLFLMGSQYAIYKIREGKTKCAN